MCNISFYITTLKCLHKGSQYTQYQVMIHKCKLWYNTMLTVLKVLKSLVSLWATPGEVPLEIESAWWDDMLIVSSYHTSHDPKHLGIYVLFMNDL